MRQDSARRGGQPLDVARGAVGLRPPFQRNKWRDIVPRAVPGFEQAAKRHRTSRLTSPIKFMAEPRQNRLPPTWMEFWGLWAKKGRA